MQIVAVGPNMIVFPRGDSETGAKTEKYFMFDSNQWKNQVLNPSQKQQRVFQILACTVHNEER